MMSAGYAARSGKEPLRQVRTSAAIVQHRWKDAGFESARNAGAIGRINQSGADQALHKGVFVRIGQTSTVMDASVRIADGIQGLFLQLRVVNSSCLLDQKPKCRLHHG